MPSLQGDVIEHREGTGMALSPPGFMSPHWRARAEDVAAADDRMSTGLLPVPTLCRDQLHSYSRLSLVPVDSFTRGTPFPTPHVDG